MSPLLLVDVVKDAVLAAQDSLPREEFDAQMDTMVSWLEMFSIAEVALGLYHPEGAA